MTTNMRETRALDVSLLVLRLILGFIFIYAGSQKLFGWFGGGGFSATLEMSQQKSGIPPVAMAIAIFAEFFGGLGVLFGVLTRIAALGIFCTMSVAAFMGIRDNYAQLFGNKQSMAMLFIGFPLACWGIAMLLMLVGGGNYTLESMLRSKKK